MASRLMEEMSDLVNRRGDAKRNNMEMATHAIDTDTQRKESEPSLRARMCRERDPHSLALGMPTGSIFVQNEMDIPQKGRNRALSDPAIPLLGI